MKKTIVSLIAICSISVQVLASEDNFSQCIENIMGKETKLFLCNKEQYLVEYKNSDCNYIKKITLITNGQAVIIKEKINK